MAAGAGAAGEEYTWREGLIGEITKPAEDTGITAGRAAAVMPMAADITAMTGTGTAAGTAAGITAMTGTVAAAAMTTAAGRTAIISTAAAAGKPATASTAEAVTAGMRRSAR
ncbi:MAG TPA: hypothetical protein DCR27_07585 [Lachnospiraceae bacterium]|nr:hypothetical protein [Lachnospiraceae bacterium]